MPSYLGVLIPPKERELVGWVICPERLQTRLEVELLCDGKSIHMMRAGLHSEYLSECGIGDGHYAFAFELPETHKPMQWSVRIVGTKHLLTHQLQFFPEEQTGFTFEGHVDGIEQGMLRGWVWNRLMPDQQVMVDIEVDGRLRDRVTAGEFRQDLKMQGKGNGAHAFHWRIPAEYFDGQSRRLQVRISNQPHELHGSPLRLLCAALPLPAFVLRRNQELLQTHCAELEKLSQLTHTSAQLEKSLTQTNKTQQFYHQWIADWDTLSEEDIRVIRKEIALWKKKPFISVVMPVHDPEPRFLQEAIESVRAQMYPHWELCIADDASKDLRIKHMLKEYTAKDKRIRLVTRKTNGHIAQATNSALEMAKGEYIAFLDHDDRLAVSALYEVAKEILHSQASILYSDEDKIDENGVRFDPHFKPDWNETLLLAHNYICHLTAIRRDLIVAVGGMRKGFEGSQDYDLLLRVTERIKPDAIRHIPRILYHWRAHENSTAESLQTKPYAYRASLEAVREHVKRSGQKAKTLEGLHQTVRVQWDLPKKPPKVSILIPTRDQSEILARCIASLTQNTRYPDYEILVIDNDSGEQATFRLFDELKKDARIRILPYPKPFNYSAINNFAAKQAKGSVLCLMNNDIEIIEEQWLDEMIGQLLRPDVGAVGAKLLYGNRRLQHGGVILGVGGVAGHAHKGLDEQAHAILLARRWRRNSRQ